MIEFTNKYRKCKDEQTFKYAFLKDKYSDSSDFVFPIETEETIKGFPDVLIIKKGSNISFLLEFKFTDGATVRFRKGQISFYKKYKELPIYVVAYSVKQEKVIIFPANELFTDEGQYKINANLEVKI